MERIHHPQRPPIAVEDGLLIVNDVRILKEMRSFTHSDADELGSSRQGTRPATSTFSWPSYRVGDAQACSREELPRDDYQQPACERPGL